MVKQITKRYRKECENSSFKDIFINKFKTNETVIDNTNTEVNIEPETKNSKKRKSKNVTLNINNNVETLNENE